MVEHFLELDDALEDLGSTDAFEEVSFLQFFGLRFLGLVSSRVCFSRPEGVERERGLGFWKQGLLVESLEIGGLLFRGEAVRVRFGEAFSVLRVGLARRIHIINFRSPGFLAGE